MIRPSQQAREAAEAVHAEMAKGAVYHVALHNAFARFEAETLARAEQVADDRMTVCLQRIDRRGYNDAKAIRDRIHCMRGDA